MLCRGKSKTLEPLAMGFKSSFAGASLVAQWLSVGLPMQGDSGSGPALGGSHMPRSNWAPWATPAEPAHLEPVLCNNRGRDGERPVHHDEEWPPLAATGESPCTETRTQHS